MRQAQTKADRRQAQYGLIWAHTVLVSHECHFYLVCNKVQYMQYVHKKLPSDAQSITDANACSHAN